MIGRSVLALGSKLSLSALLVCAAAGTANADTPPAAGAPAAVVQQAAYTDPAPVRIYRFHVYSTMKARWKKTVTVETLVTTSERGVAEGDRGLLQRKIEVEGAPTEWAPVAKVLVKKVLPKGKLEVEIEAEETEATVKRGGKLPYARGQKVRLEIDRVL